MKLTGSRLLPFYPVRFSALIACAFRTRRPDESHRARLRVEIGRLRALVTTLAHIEATARGFVLKPHGERAVVVLAPPIDGEQASLQDSNDHFLANIQRNGSYSVVPRVPGGDITPEHLIVDEDVAISITLSGYIKRTPITTYRAQRRGGRGRQGARPKDEDAVTTLFVTSRTKSIRC